MGRITLDMVRKGAEHNEGELSTLEEISLHQRDIEKIERLHRWCPRLRILLLQGNLISRIENVSRFRDLEYLNLALNNVEVVEGLERCEALVKLDFTANFITDLGSLATLQDLPNLRELYLTGNPCTSYRGYRSWVICTLPGLQELDGTAITRSQRLRALQDFSLADSTVREDQQIAIEKRTREKEKFQEEEEKEKKSIQDAETISEEEWWNSSSEHSPESRLALHRELQERRKREEANENKKRARPLKLFTSDGRPLNVNSAKLEFHLKDDEERNCFVLEVHTYKYLDPSLVDCDVEPWYVRVTLKKKILQLVLLEEVRPGQATAKRSSITGHLVVTMPKLLSPIRRNMHHSSKEVISLLRDDNHAKDKKENMNKNEDTNEDMKPNYLEVGELSRRLDYTRIVQDNEDKASRSKTAVIGPGTRTLESLGRPDSPGFIDDDSVPPLE